MRNRAPLLSAIAVYLARPGRRARLRTHYAPFIAPGTVVFDVGANVGGRTRAFLDLGARVVAVEPHPRLARYLRRTHRRREQLTILEVAAGSAAGTTTLFESPGNLTVSTTSSDWAARAADQPGWESVRYSRPLPVRVTTLDQLIREFGAPGFVKIDVEGSEDEVLAGLSQPLPALSFEFLPADRDVALHAVLRLERLASEAGYGYEYNFSLGEDLRLVMPDRWWKAAELNAYLAEIPVDGPSGDVYARRLVTRE